jgi:hypothetical protein
MTKIQKELEKLEQIEQEINIKEQKILDIETRIEKELKGKPLNAYLLSSVWANKLARRKFVYYFLLTLSGTLIWYGFWTLIERIPVLANPFVALVAGFSLAWLIRAYNKNA